MNEFFGFFSDYLRGNSIYNPLNKSLNILFNASISSFIFERTYGHYEWIDIVDYKSILNFFIRGDFSIPLSIFIIVFISTEIISFFIFTILTGLSKHKWIKRIVQYQLNKDEIGERVKLVVQIIQKKIAIPLNRNTTSMILNQFKENLTGEVLINLKEELKIPMDKVEETFHLLFKITIAFTIYFVTIERFGWKLYIVVLVILLICLLLLLFIYSFLELLPIMISKLHQLTVCYLSEERDTEISKETDNTIQNTA